MYNKKHNDENPSVDFTSQPLTLKKVKFLEKTRITVVTYEFIRQSNIFLNLRMICTDNNITLFLNWKNCHSDTHVS